MKKNSQAFVNQLVICLLVTMTFGGSIGLGTVWVRHQNSMTAKANQLLAKKIAEVERRSDDMKTLIQTEQRPVLLRKLNDEMRLGLVPMTMDRMPIVRVTEDPVRRLAEKVSREAAQESEVTLAPVRLNLALR
jgi:hypothetical protein